MNLYQFHSQPKSLNHHDDAHSILPELFWPRTWGRAFSNENKTFLKSKEKYIAKNAKYSYEYANFLQKPFKLGESAIATNAFCSYAYAYNILHKSFKLGEKVISTDTYYSFIYAKHVLLNRFKLGEAVISKDLTYCLEYNKYLKLQNIDFVLSYQQK